MTFSLDMLEQKGMQQGQLAMEAGVSRQSMSSYESGKYSPDIIALKKMAESLGCTTDYLLGLSEYPFYESQAWTDQYVSELSDALSTIPFEQRKAWLGVFSGLAKCIGQGLKEDSCAVFSTKPFFTLERIWSSCLSNMDKQRAGEYTVRAMRSAQDNLRKNMQSIRNDWNELEDICFQLITPLPGDDDTGSDNTNNTITHKNEG